MGWDHLYKRDQVASKREVTLHSKCKGLPYTNTRSSDVAERNRKRQAELELREQAKGSYD